MKIALYCRVSTDEQAKHGESIADQEQALIRFAESRQATYDIYKDPGYSAHRAYTTRPDLKRLLENIKEYDLVCFTKLDRWTRKTADYYKLEERLTGVPWRAILEDYETETATGRLRVGIMLSVNQHEAERTGERIKFTFEEKRKRGEIVSGNMPRGYKLENKKPVKDEAAAEAVSAFWDAYFIGGLGAAQQAAAEHGMPLPVSSASFMLRNANSYAGHIQGVECEAYITQEQADLITGSRKSRPKKAANVFLFSGLVFCAECGGRFGGHLHNYKKADGTDGTQKFYNCNHRHKFNPHQCENRTCIYESDIERYLLTDLNSIIARYEAEANSASSAVDEKEIASKLNALEAKKRRAYDAYVDGIVSKADFERQMQKLEASIAAIKIPAPEKKKAPVQLPDNWQEAYKSASMENKRLFWLRIIKEIRISKDRSIDVIPL